MTTSAEIRSVLAQTTIPPEVADALVAQAPDLWLMSETSVELLASDLALCHPSLGPREVRASAVPIDRLGTWRLSIVARDRPGLLADTTGVLAAAGVPVLGASALTLTARRLALHSLVVSAPRLTETGWRQLGGRVQAAANGRAPRVRFEPRGVAEVTCTGRPRGLHLLTVSAPDQTGLLSAICRAVAEQALSIDVAHAVSQDGRAEDLFVVDGQVDVDDLAARLSASGRSRVAEVAFGVLGQIPVVGGLVGKALAKVV